MKRIFLLLIVALVPASFFLSAWQTFNHQQLQSNITRLEGQQRELIEKNRRLLTLMAELESPMNVVERAQRELKMDWPRQDQLRRLRVNREASGGR
jgi:cell division protein FtsL